MTLTFVLIVAVDPSMVVIRAGRDLSPSVVLTVEQGALLAAGTCMYTIHTLYTTFPIYSNTLYIIVFSWARKRPALKKERGQHNYNPYESDHAIRIASLNISSNMISGGKRHFRDFTFVIGFNLQSLSTYVQLKLEDHTVFVLYSALNPL